MDSDVIARGEMANFMWQLGLIAAGLLAIMLIVIMAMIVYMHFKGDDK